MLLSQIKEWFSFGEKCEGISLIEALLATAILGIGFAGVYTITAVSSQTMTQSIARQELQMQANQILDLIESDIANIDQYVMLLETCVPPGQGENAKYQLRKYEWCLRLEGEVGSAAGNNERSINVTTLVDGRKVVHVLLESNGGLVQVVMNRVYDG